MLLKRVITAVILVAVLLAAIFLLPRPATAAVLAALMLGGAWEWAAFLGRSSVSGRLVYVGVVASLMALVGWFSRDGSGLAGLYGASLALWLVALLGIVNYPFAIRAWVAGLAGVLALVPAWIALAQLHIGLPAGPVWLLFLFLVVWAADVGAFFVGRTVGRTKLALRVSPGKTWEGVLGGVILTGIAGAAGAWWFDVRAAALVPLCLGVAGISVVGDLTVSMFKRNVGLKDSGGLFPGHGGVLDRIDSLIAAAPLFVLGLGWLGIMS